MSTKAKIPISVIIMTKNEELVLAHTLSSVAAFDQVVVVDSHSDDRTVAVAEQHKAEIVQFSWNGNYPKKKEWSLLNIAFRNDWVLYLDADEMVTQDLASELRLLLKSGTQHAAFDIQLDYYFLGHKLKHGHKVSKRALVRRHQTNWPHIDDLDVGNMWEVEGHYQPIINGSVGRLTGRLEHNDLDPLYDYFARHNRYSDWEAHLTAQRGVADTVNGVRSVKGRRYANFPFKPAAFFFYSFLVRRGFLDGKAGLHYAIAHAFYFWQISVKQTEYARNQGSRYAQSFPAESGGGH
jgi:glycosyltransferase involved in cell wall biosynthesis